ncbi:MAG: CoxG family protein [Haloarculaceae archaeon]
MEFDGKFELDDTTMDDVWLALSDPVMVQHALPGCQFLVEVEDEDVDFDAPREQQEGEERELTADPEVIEGRAFEEGGIYAALVEISVGSVSPSFETVVTIDDRAFPEMKASGEGNAGNSSFEMESGMTLSETDDGVAIEWYAEADVFGRIAQMGQRMLNPVANRVVKRFFKNMQSQLEDLQMSGDGEVSEKKQGVVDRLKGAFGGGGDDDNS